MLQVSQTVKYTVYTFRNGIDRYQGSPYLLSECIGTRKSWIGASLVHSCSDGKQASTFFQTSKNSVMSLAKKV